MDAKLTPMMRQYLEIKKKHPGDILFFRLGDFYEMFFDDARTASKILDIVLTSRQNDIPMCGIPYHAADSYIARLIKAGCRVAICEQLESVPASGTVVKREVTRVITPGTLVEANLLQSDENNFLGAVIAGGDETGMAFIDISTGDFYLQTMAKSFDLFRGEITRFSPREVILHVSDDGDSEKYTGYLKNRGIPINTINEWLYDADYLEKTICETFGLNGIKGLGITGKAEIMAAGAILEYLRDTRKVSPRHLKLPRRIVSSRYMMLDDSTIANLELVKNQQDGGKQRTLYSVLNHCLTPMGKRALERNILHPLHEMDEITARLDTVQYLAENRELTGNIQELLKRIYDLERILTRCIMGRYNPRDLLAVGGSLAAAAEIRDLIGTCHGNPCGKLADKFPDLGGLADTIAAVIDENPALSPEHGHVVKRGKNPELDSLYDLKKDTRSWIMNYQEEEKSRLGIPTLKVKYNRILGYYIEVSKGQTARVPHDYYRKQTLVGSERYTTEKLQEFESEILGASEKIIEIETAEVEALLSRILELRADIQATAVAVGEIDYFCSLACAAGENRFVRPAFNGEGTTRIKDGRHPVVEKYYTSEVFIPNDITLDSDERLITIITGPNMSGKSTYLRMAALIQLMSQIGSFVPADSADLALVDRIYTRIGASDNISRGESTFLVEMNETAVILNNATEKSLIIMDEVGRGTSTFDGISIAWAVVEYILRYLKARTLFATHYHELTSLADKKGIVNCNVQVREHLRGVDFLHKVVPGSADRSYGIHVARLAGIPREITSRAETILDRMERTSRSSASRRNGDEEKSQEQLEMFNAANHLVIQAISTIDVDGITPLEAINELNRLKKLIE